MKIFTSFLLVGIICAIGSLIYDMTKLTPGHITSLFVVIGAVLGFFNIYDSLINNYGFGLLLPITSFGNSLLKGAYEGLQKGGIIGLFNGIFSLTSVGISSTIIFSFLISMVCKPKD